ncbi:hypothetical protein EZS27_041415, partial [termite gut metagenome]
IKIRCYCMRENPYLCTKVYKFIINRHEKAT